MRPFTLSVVSFMTIALINASFLSSAQAAHNGSLGLVGGIGGYSNSGWPLSAYGLSLAMKGDRRGELALDYTVNQINANSAYPYNGGVILQQYELDLRHRFADRFGFYLGLPINYFSSSNESIVPSGMTLGIQLGYDHSLADRISVGLHLQDTFIRNFYQALLTLKLWAAP
jgi:hypothetical protein